MITDATRETILNAMEQFDQELRHSPEWVNWEQKESYKYAIEQNGFHYPIKKIVSIAADTPVSDFSGGDESNSLVEKLGFKVVSLRQPRSTDSLQALIQEILASYVPARSTGRFGKDHPLWQLFTRF